MRKSQTKFEYVKSIVLLLMIVTLVAAFIGWNVSPTKDDISLHYNMKTQQPLEWHDAQTDDSLDGEIVTVAPGEKLMIYTTLPDSVYADASISYYDMGFHIKAFINGQLIYEGGADGNVTFGKETGAIWRNISLKSGYASKDLYIEFENLSHSALHVTADDLTIGQENDIVTKMMQSSKFTLLECVILAVLMIVLLAYSFVVYFGGYKKQGKIIGSLALTSLVVAGWIFFDGTVSQLFFHSGSMRYSLSYICFCLIPFFTGTYFKYMLDVGKKCFSIILLIYEILISVAFVLSFLGIRHISYSLFLAQGCEIVLAIAVGFYSIRALKMDKSRAYLGSLIAFAITFGISAFGLYKYYTYNRTNITAYMGAGFIAFVLIVGLTEISNIVKHFHSEQKIRNFRELAKVDSVTGGNSRFVAAEWLDNVQLEFYDSVWMLHMDLMHFSSVNATVGWNNGDIILKGIYENNLRFLRANDLQCNVGNAEFLFVLTNREEVDSFCSLLSRELADYMKQEWHGIVLNAEYAAIKIQPGDNLELLLDAVQMAYHNPLADFNKEANCYYFNEACREKARHDLVMESQITDALEREEFQMYLQPKVNPLLGQAEGAEALIRWNSKDGLISPAQFIPILEKSGQIREVDLFMFRKVCDYIVDAEKKGKSPQTISVNVSKTGISNPRFFDAYMSIIRETKVPTEYLEFEFTESTAFDDIVAVDALIQKMHKIGAKVSMDDFGSAYSNLAVIGKLNFDVVKLDKVFFDNGFPNNETDYILVQGLIRMFHDMKILVVCEGIEEEDQAKALTKIGVDLIQGFYYASPMPSEKYWDWKPEK